MRVRGWATTTALLGTGLAITTLACGPAAAPVPTPTAEDPFAVVRATSQAAYVSGKAHLDRGELQQALIDLDTAKTDDPDNRQDIQQALDQAVRELQSTTPATTPAQTPGSTPTQTSAPPTAVAAASTPGPPGTPSTPGAPGAQSTLGTPNASGTRSAPGTPAAVPTPAAQLTSPTALAAAPGMQTFVDPQGRFTIQFPAAWTRLDPPQALFGTPVIEYRDSSGRAEADVAVDTSTQAVSPELYAASMELAMQRQIPGYASEQVLPGTTAGLPSVRRVFTFTQRDSSGTPYQARGFQVALLKGSTPYVLSGSSPADQFQQLGSTFDQIVASFRFS